MQQGKRKTTLVLSVTALLFVAFILLTSASNMVLARNSVIRPTDEVSAPSLNPLSIYSGLNLKELGLSENAFKLALKGWSKLKAKGEVSRDIISICDFTQSSNNKRLYIIDLATGTLLFNTLVAHGKNTGDEFAHYFSNSPSSLKSSLGFYVTKEAYEGSHGLGLKLMGIEPGFNDRAEERAIVMHGANYVCNEFIDQYGRLGKSWGCPAVPFELHEQIINTIKDGTCLFIYFPDKAYLAASKLIR
jgi:hypothetical protein